MKKLLLTAILLCPLWANAELAVAVSPAKITGQKAVVRLEMTNNFTNRIESARAVAFLADGQGKVLGGANKWVIGGGHGKPGLEAGATNAFYFVITSAKPFTGTNLTTKVTFSRVVLSGGKLADPVREVVVTAVEKEALAPRTRRSPGPPTLPWAFRSGLFAAIPRPTPRRTTWFMTVAGSRSKRSATRARPTRM